MKDGLSLRSFLFLKKEAKIMRLEARKAGNGKIHLVHNGDANDGQNYWELDHKNVREVMERMDEIASEYEKEAKQPKEKEEKSVDEA